MKRDSDPEKAGTVRAAWLAYRGASGLPADDYRSELAFMAGAGWAFAKMWDSSAEHRLYIAARMAEMTQNSMDRLERLTERVRSKSGVE